MENKKRDWTKINKNRSRNKRVVFSLTEEEFKRLNESVENTLYDRSQYIRAVLFHGKITVVTRDIQKEKMINKASNFVWNSKILSNNLNQIARVVNRRMLMNDLPEALEVLPELLEKTRKEMILIKEEFYKMFENYDI